MKKLLREYTLALLLLAGCGVLALILVLQGVLHRIESAQVLAPPRLDTPVDLAGATDEEQAFSLKALDEYAEIVERPLFQEGRRPGKASTEDSSAPAHTPFNFKLMGVIVTPRDRTALLLDAKNKYKRVRPNALVGGWRVVEIGTDRVILQQGEEVRELPLLKPKPKLAASPSQPGKVDAKGQDTPEPSPQAPPDDGEIPEEPIAEEEMPVDEEINE
jgi:type II secretory pathway component PulC